MKRGMHCIIENGNLISLDTTSLKRCLNIDKKIYVDDMLMMLVNGEWLQILDLQLISSLLVWPSFCVSPGSLAEQLSEPLLR